MTTPQFFLSTWSWSPIVIGVCLLALAVYVKAMKFRLTGQSLYFIAAVTLFFLTLSSPVNTLAAGYLFSAHMLQHLLLLLVIPPLALLGLPECDRISFVGWTTDRFRLHPVATWLAGLSAMWIWHERTLCDAATTTQAGRIIQIISLLGLGAIFWWPIVGPQKDRRLLPLLGVVYLFSTCVGCTILGVLITFAPVGVVCPVYLHPVDRLGLLPLIRDQWGLTPAKDQQIGGLMMWVPACGIYVFGVIALLARWYRTAEKASDVEVTEAAKPEPSLSPRPIGEKA
jgi:putative membrane protein